MDFLRPIVLGGLSLLWTGWRTLLVYVQAGRVVRWQRERFRRFWARRSSVKSAIAGDGRLETGVEIRSLIERMVTANPLLRIHGELNILGIWISERTVCKILQTAAAARPDVEGVPSPWSDGFD
jgi:hypothetical protein